MPHNPDLDGELCPTLTRLARGGREFAIMSGDLLGVVLAVAPVNHFVACQGGWVKFAFGRRDQVEMATAVGPPRRAGAHPHTAGQPTMRRDVADADADTAMGRTPRPTRRGPAGCGPDR